MSCLIKEMNPGLRVGEMVWALVGEVSRPGSSRLSFHFGPETKLMCENLSGCEILPAGRVAGQ